MRSVKSGKFFCFFFPLDGKDVEGGLWEEDKAPKIMILKIMCYLKS